VIEDEPKNESGNDELEEILRNEQATQTPNEPRVGM